MRGLWIVTVLAVAGCGENQGWNPNYRHDASAYGRYLVAREVALTKGTDAPQTIPVALPAEAPGPDQISGRSAKKPATPAAAAAAPAAAMPVAGSGRYPGSTPVLVRYALEADHAPGRAVYSRPGGSAAVAARACAGHATADAAQIAFLAAGGPRQDPRGMDPDGDGFVCGWDPAPFRANQL